MIYIQAVPTKTFNSQKKAKALNFRYKKRDDTINDKGKTKMLISCAVRAQLICVFALANAKSWFSCDVTHMISDTYKSDRFHLKVCLSNYFVRI